MLDLDGGSDDADKVHGVTVLLTPGDLCWPRIRHLTVVVVLLLVLVIHRAFQPQAPIGG